MEFFGKYCKIEMKRFGCPNEFYIHKIVGLVKTNTYRDVPLVTGKEAVYHEPTDIIGDSWSDYLNSMEDVLLVIQCGIDETEVIKVALKDVEIFDNRSYSELEQEISARDSLIKELYGKLSQEDKDNFKDKASELGIVVQD